MCSVNHTVIESELLINAMHTQIIQLYSTYRLLSIDS